MHLKEKKNQSTLSVPSIICYHLGSGKLNYRTQTPRTQCKSPRYKRNLRGTFGLGFIKFPMNETAVHSSVSQSNGNIKLCLFLCFEYYKWNYLIGGLSAYWLIPHSESGTCVVSPLNIQRCPVWAGTVQGLSVSVAKRKVCWPCMCVAPPSPLLF